MKRLSVVRIEKIISEINYGPYQKICFWLDPYLEIIPSIRTTPKQGPTVNHKNKVSKGGMGRQIRENEFFLSPAAKNIYFRKTKNRISINYDMR
jgi:hypothetical protein